MSPWQSVTLIQRPLSLHLQISSICLQYPFITYSAKQRFTEEQTFDKNHYVLGDIVLFQWVSPACRSCSEAKPRSVCAPIAFQSRMVRGGVSFGTARGRYWSSGWLVTNQLKGVVDGIFVDCALQVQRSWVEELSFIISPSKEAISCYDNIRFLCTSINYINSLITSDSNDIAFSF